MIQQNVAKSCGWACKLERTTASTTGCAIAADISGPATADTMYQVYRVQKLKGCTLEHSWLVGIAPDPAKQRERDTNSSLRLLRSFITLFTGNIMNSSSCKLKSSGSEARMFYHGTWNAVGGVGVS